jgi:hypothetical protein
MVPVRKQIYLTRDLDRMLKQASRDRGRSEADIVREALESYLGGRPGAENPLLGLLGKFKDWEPNIGRDHDVHLYEKEAGPCPACSSSTHRAGSRHSRRW